MSTGTDTPGWQSVRRRVLDRDGHACRFCGTTDDEHRQEHDAGLHVHHIIPEADGGEDEPENLITVCCRCHRTLEETHAKAVGELEATDARMAKAGATFAHRKCWATADCIDDQLAEFINNHPTFQREFTVYDETGDDRPPCIESREFREMVGDVSSEWAFLINWGYKHELLSASGFIEGWAPEAIDEEALEESSLPDPTNLEDTDT